MITFQTFDCVIKVRTEWYTNRSRRGQWVNGWVVCYMLTDCEPALPWVYFRTYSLGGNNFLECLLYLFFVPILKWFGWKFRVLWLFRPPRINLDLGKIRISCYAHLLPVQAVARAQPSPGEVWRQQRPVRDDIRHQPRLPTQGGRHPTGVGPHFQAGESEVQRARPEHQVEIPASHNFIIDSTFTSYNNMPFWTLVITK